MNTDQTLNPSTDQPHDDSPFSPEQLTAWALGEGEILDQPVRLAIAAAYDADPIVRADVEAVRATAALFTDDLGAEPAGTLSAEQRAAILAVSGDAAGDGKDAGSAETRLGTSAPPRDNQDDRDNVIRPRWADRLRHPERIGWPTALAAALAVVFIGIPLLRWSAATGGYILAEVYLWQDRARSSTGHDQAAKDSLSKDDRRLIEAWKPASLADYLLWHSPSGGPTTGDLAMSRGAVEEMQEAASGSASMQEAEESLALIVQPTSAAIPDMLATAAPPADAPAPPPSDPSRKIIKDAAMAIEVANLDLSLSRIGGIAAQAGGYVLETATDRDAGSDKHATVKIGVPVDQFEVTLGRIREVAAKVISEQSSGVDVSQEFVDLQSRIANLEATQARMRQFLAQATTVEEALRVNAQLSEIEGQLSEVKGRLQYLAGRAAYSTIAVDLRQPAPPATVTPTPTATATPTPAPGWSPRAPASAALETLQGLLQTLTTAGIWFGIVILPFALPVALAAWWVQKRK